MDWTKQNEEMFKTWTKAQTKMWEAYTDSVSNFGKSPGEKVWGQTVATGEELVKNSLAAQAEWMKTWAENFKSLDGMPEQSTEALKQFQEMTERWAATQENLWAAWFDMLKKFDPSQFDGHAQGSIPGMAGEYQTGHGYANGVDPRLDGAIHTRSGRLRWTGPNIPNP